MDNSVWRQYETIRRSMESDRRRCTDSSSKATCQNGSCKRSALQTSQLSMQQEWFNCWLDNTYFRWVSSFWVASYQPCRQETKAAMAICMRCTSRYFKVRSGNKVREIIVFKLDHNYKPCMNRSHCAGLFTSQLFWCDCNLLRGRLLVLMALLTEVEKACWYSNIFQVLPSSSPHWIFQWFFSGSFDGDVGPKVLCWKPWWQAVS